MSFDEQFRTNFIFICFAANAVLFIAYKFTKKFKIIHAIVSALDNICIITFAAVSIYQKNHYLAILVPCVLLFVVYPVSYAVNAELSDDDKAAIVGGRGILLLPTEIRRKLKINFIELGTFPFYYLISSWRRLLGRGKEGEE